MVYTGFSNASVPSACHSFATCLPLNIWKSAPFKRANQHFWNTQKQAQMHTHTNTTAVWRCTFTHSPALQAMHAHTHKFAQEYFALHWITRTPEMTFASLGPGFCAHEDCWSHQDPYLYRKRSHWGNKNAHTDTYTQTHTLWKSHCDGLKCLLCRLSTSPQLIRI